MGPLRRALAESSSSLVICAFNGIGDGVLAMPVLRAICDELDPGRVVLWAYEDVLETAFMDLDVVRAPVRVDRWGTVLHPGAEDDLARLARLPLRAPFWLSVNAYFPITDLEARGRALLQPKGVWEFGEDPRALRQLPNGLARPMRDQFWALIGEGRPGVDAGLAFAVSPEGRRAARHLCPEAPLVIHVDTTPDKEWPRSWWESAIVAARRRIGAPVIAVGRPPEWVREIPGVRVAPSGWDIHVALVERAVGFLGVDSCFGHVADALGRAGVVLFRNSDPLEWGPRGPGLVSVTGGDDLSSDAVASLLSDRIQHAECIA